MIWFLGLAVLIVFILWRRRLMTFSAVGVYSMMFLVTNFIGIHWFLAGHDLLSNDTHFYVSSAARVRAALIADFGILSVWAGVWFVGLAARAAGERDQRRLAMHRRWRIDNAVPISGNGQPRLGLVPIRVVVAGLALSAIFVGLYHSYLLESIRAVFAFNRSTTLGFRLTVGQEGPYLLTTVAYNALPYAALALLVVYWMTGRFRGMAILVYALAVAGLLHTVQKQPVLIFIVMTLACRQVLKPYRVAQMPRLTRRTTRRMRRRSMLRSGRIILVGFAVLTGLYYSTEGSSYSSDRSSSLDYSVTLGAQRVFLRTAQGYELVAALVPEEIDHTGLRNIVTLQRIIGGEPVYVNTDIFARFSNVANGSIASDSLSNNYIEYGFFGVFVLGVLQGVLLAILDRWLARTRTIDLAVVFGLFAMRFAVYLNETHIFGAFLGFGGLVSIVMAVALHSRRPVPPGDGIRENRRPVTAQYRVAAR